MTNGDILRVDNENINCDRLHELNNSMFVECLPPPHQLADKKYKHDPTKNTITQTLNQ